MERLTVNDLSKVCYGPWELCGMDNHCTKGCHEEGGCTKECNILKMYRKLAEYEDLEEQGLLLKLPCNNWMDIVFGEQEIFWGIDESYIENPIREITVDNSERLTWYDGWETVVLRNCRKINA